MKKIIALLLAVMMAFGCTVAAFAEIYPSPTAPTIIPPHPSDPETVTGPTAPHITEPGTGSTKTTTPSSGTTAPVTKPTTPSSGTTGTTGPLTTPDGSTITATVKPDTNPDSPKTGDTSTAVFAFAAIAMIGAVATVTLRKKDDDAQ